MKKILIVVLVCFSVVFSGILYAYFTVKTGEFSGYEWSKDDKFSLNSVIDFKVDGQTAKILQISDLHFAYIFGRLNDKNYQMLDKVLEVEQPDLVVVTGDLNIALFNGPMIKRFGEYMDSKKMYWAYSLGNHDCQFGLGEYRYLSKLFDFEYCLFKIGPTNLGSYLNYFMRVINSSGKVLSTISIINNGNSVISDNLKDWYRWNIENLNKQHARKVENLMFVHIPFEIMHKYTGNLNEAVSIMDDDNDITSVIEELDTTHHIFNGHDHLNNFEFTYNNVTYYSTPSFGFCGYGKTNVERGLRIISVSDTIDIKLKGQSDYGF